MAYIESSHTSYLYCTVSIDKMSVRSVGIDLGSSKTVLIADDGDLVLTATGGVSRPSVLCFQGRSRYIDEEAASQNRADSIIKAFNLYLEGKDSSCSIPEAAIDDAGRVTFPIQYNDDCTDMSATSVLGMFLAKQIARVDEVYPAEKVKLAFVLSPIASVSAATTIKQACCVAGVPLERVSTVNKAEALKIAYTRKVQALQAGERSALENNKVVVVEMGNTSTTALLIDTHSLDAKTTPLFAAGGPTVRRCAFNADLGAAHFDLAIFKHFAAICVQKHQTEVSLHSRRGRRLIAGCERVRKLLSQLPEASVTVENLTDNGDVSFKLTRDELEKLAQPQLETFKKMLVEDLLAGMSAREIAEVAGVEILGGGSRMTVVQTIICNIFRDNKNINNTTGPGTTAASPITSAKALGAKLDDGSIGLGAALISNNQLDDSKVPGPEADANNYSKDVAVYVPLGAFAAAGPGKPTAGVGFSADEVATMVAAEAAMQAQDGEILQLLAARNDLEAFLLNCRGFKRHKYGTAEYMDVAALEKTLDEHENWMYDEPDAPLAEVKSKFAALQVEVNEQICKKYFEAIAADKKEVEAQLAVEADKAAAEKAANPDEDRDVDSRKLKKADRMRLVMKNKDEATEIFKGGVFKTACARYSMALTHCTKFFDLSPEDETEVKALKVTLYLNIAMCYLKMGKNDQVINNCDHALALDSRSAKAYFRRSAAWEAKKDLEKALEDAKKAQAEMVVPDKGINSTVGRLTKSIAAEKKKSAKMWGNAFGK